MQRATTLATSTRAGEKNASLRPVHRLDQQKSSNRRTSTSPSKTVKSKGSSSSKMRKEKSPGTVAVSIKSDQPTSARRSARLANKEKEARRAANKRN